MVPEANVARAEAAALVKTLCGHVSALRHYRHLVGTLGFKPAERGPDQAFGKAFPSRFQADAEQTNLSGIRHRMQLAGNISERRPLDGGRHQDLLRASLALPPDPGGIERSG